MVKIYLGLTKPEALGHLCDAGHKNALVSFSVLRMAKTLTLNHLIKYKEMGINYFMDSGAYTFAKEGRKDYPLTYIDYCDFLKKNADLFDAWAVPDVIGDYEKTMSYAEYMVENGVPVDKTVYVVHSPRSGSSFDYVFDAIDKGFTYVGLGGWVGASDDVKDKYLEEIYYKILDKGCKVHLFGLTSAKLLLKYRPYSCDSVSWVQDDSFSNAVRLNDGSVIATYGIDEESKNHFKQLSYDLFRFSVERGLFQKDVRVKYLYRIWNASYFSFLEKVLNDDFLYELYKTILDTNSFSEGFYKQLGEYLFSLEKDEEVFNTPRRWINALTEYLFGYIYNVYEVVGKDFKDVSREDMDKVLKVEVPFSSLCVHHLLPFYGKVHIEYVPSDKILGLSKFSRIVYVLSRRLQIQEKLTREIYEVLYDVLKPKSLKVKIKAKHLCSRDRGIKVGSVFTTEVSSNGNSGDREGKD